MSRGLRFLRALVVVLLVVVIVGVNVMAWMQARALTHFTEVNDQPPQIEQFALGEQLQVAVFGIPVPRPVNEFTPADGGYAFDTHMIPLPDDQWLEAWAVTQTEARGMVLLFPGYAASKQQVLIAAQVFFTAGYSVLLVDFRGVGGSSGSTTTLGVREAEDVAFAVAYARQQWAEQPLILYAVSMGSTAVLRAVAREGVQPDAIIVETPFERLSTAIQTRLRLTGMPTFPTTELLLFWGGVQHGIDAFGHNPIDDAAAVTAPTLVLRGELDDRVSAAEISGIYEGLGGPKRQATVPGLGHTVLVPESPEAQQQVVQFLAETLAGTTP